MVCFISLKGGCCVVSACRGWSGSNVFCLSCDACSFKCSVMGSVCVSECRC